jgi:hypothetical protein
VAGSYGQATAFVEETLETLDFSGFSALQKLAAVAILW